MMTCRSLIILISSLTVATLFSESKNEVKVDARLLSLERQVVNTVDQVKNSVVALIMKQDGKTVGSGSGVIVSNTGLIFTAAHVVEGQSQVTAILADETEVPVEVLGMNLYKDAAVCQMIDTSREWPHSPLGDSDALRVTDWVIAMGHGRGYDKTRTAPVRFGRIRAHNPGRFLTSDCPLIGGDSGGPLFNIKGEVIAINSSINGLARFNVHAGVSGFKDDLERMTSGERWGTLMPNVLYTPETPVLGVKFIQKQGRYAERYKVPVIDKVTKDSPAFKAGLKRGDLLKKIADETVLRQNDVFIALGRQRAGDSIDVIFERNQELRSTKVLLEPRSTLVKDNYRKIGLPNLSTRDDSPYVKESDKPLLTQQVNDIYDWARPLSELRGDSYLQLFDAEDVTTPLLHATVIKDEIALAPLSSFLLLPDNVFAWRPGIDAHPVELIGAYQEHDLAVLSIRGLTVSQYPLEHSVDVELGSFLAAVTNLRNENDIAKLGVVSVKKRNLAAFFGIGFDLLKSDPLGVVIKQVERDNAADKIGLQPGDVISTVNGVRVENGNELIAQIQKMKVGQDITVEYYRNNIKLEATTKLIGKPNDNHRIKTMDHLGSNTLSVNTDSFQTVIQSDMLLSPEECGTPIYSLNGGFVGIAISDAGRNKSYIVPASAILEAVQSKPQQIDFSSEPKKLSQRPRIPEGTPQLPNAPSRKFNSEELLKRHREEIRRMQEFIRPESGDPFRELDRIFEEFFSR